MVLIPYLGNSKLLLVLDYPEGVGWVCSVRIGVLVKELEARCPECPKGCPKGCVRLEWGIKIRVFKIILN